MDIAFKGVGLKKRSDNTFDHAELGFNTIAAHGHADALHITLMIDGEKIFIDPGTYCYHSDITWRNYFRKTKNHNTVTINQENQSENEKGLFCGGDAQIHCYMNPSST